MKDIVNKVVIQFCPLAVFLGGSRGCNFQTSCSDTDIIITMDKKHYSYYNKIIDGVHYITTTIEHQYEKNITGLLFLENMLYCSSNALSVFFKTHLREMNSYKLVRNIYFQTGDYHPHLSYKIVAYYNYYYNDNKLLNMREPDCQYHSEYKYIIDFLHKELDNFSINVQESIQSFYKAAEGDVYGETN